MELMDIPVGQYDIAIYPVRQRTAVLKRHTFSMPTDDALKLARVMAKRVHRPAQVRRGFVGRSASAASLPPLAQIMRSGRGSAVRLKLYLTILWIAVGAPHSIRASASAWATLLDIQDRSGNGARQIRSAMSWLEDRHFISSEPLPGVGAVVTLKSDLGNGDPYEVPGVAIAKAKANGASPSPRDYYDSVPEGLWTNGWIHVLSGAAIAMLLILLDTQRGADAERELWLSDKAAVERYGLSEETRAKGLAELTAFEVVERHERAFRSNDLGATRRRYVYLLRTDRLGGPINPTLEIPSA